uniref:Family with sequence similarity 110 member C n=1 Tax=Oryzias latipes TaxID=8090 RepID=A0A3P9J006_ORYLA
MLSGLLCCHILTSFSGRTDSSFTKIKSNQIKLYLYKKALLIHCATRSTLAFQTKTKQKTKAQYYNENTNSDATKILGKGPEYFRKQMERDNKGHMSAVERLAASKPIYVKSQQVVNSCQEPVINLSPFTVSSTGSSNLPLKHGGNLVTGNSPTSVAQDSSPGQERRSSSKKRPDSLLIYRQKCESLRGPANNRKHPMSRKLLLGPVNGNVPLLENASKESVEEHSTESSNDSDFDVFFKYCGLDSDIIDSLGRENFSTCSDEISMSIIRSVSVSTSDDGFSRDSGDSDGLLEKELEKKENQGTSVIERNARIIKWLYSCKNALRINNKNKHFI